MLGNTFGRAFRVTACGESYGGGLLIICDGVPAGLKLGDADIQAELDRRRPGQSAIDSPRKETDRVQLVSGIQDGYTTGAPVGMVIFNVDRQQEHVDQYASYKDVPRPGHAGYTYFMKYGPFADWKGAGRASGRETACRVAAGALAKMILAREGIEVVGYVKELYGIRAKDMSLDEIKANVEKTPLRCGDLEAAEQMIATCLKVKDEGDTVGGIIECIARGVPPGVGEPVFDKLSAVIAHGIMSIPAVKGVEIGDGFAAARLKGTENNDIQYLENGKVKFRTNHAGGILGGISNGDDIVVRVAIKPTPTVSIPQQAVDLAQMKEITLSPITRRDPTICGRAVPVIESMIRLAILDLLMLNRGYQAVARIDNPWMDHLAPRWS